MPIPPPTLASIQVGTVRILGRDEAPEPFDKAWTTGIFKTTVEGPVHVTTVGIDGDAQADLTVHGGPDKALCAYSASHYPAWRAELALPGFVHGAFGENLTIGGLAEGDICIGDTWLAGDVVLQVTQPRQPCWKLSQKWRVRTLTAQVLESGRTGWYFRVLRVGDLAAGMPLTLDARPHAEWTITAANAVMHHRKEDVAAAKALAALPELSQSWRATLTRRIAG
jgi:MOSC domain-containing protein YiiM